jgi:hypothetical protein
MIKKDLEANNLSIDMTYDKILCFGPCHWPHLVGIACQSVLFLYSLRKKYTFGKSSLHCGWYTILMFLWAEWLGLFGFVWLHSN